MPSLEPKATKWDSETVCKLITENSSAFTFLEVSHAKVGVHTALLKHFSEHYSAVLFSHPTEPTVPVETDYHTLNRAIGWMYTAKLVKADQSPYTWEEALRSIQFACKYKIGSLEIAFMSNAVTKIPVDATHLPPCSVIMQASKVGSVGFWAYLCETYIKYWDPRSESIETRKQRRALPVNFTNVVMEGKAMALARVMDEYAAKAGNDAQAVLGNMRNMFADKIWTDWLLEE